MFFIKKAMLQTADSLKLNMSNDTRALLVSVRDGTVCSITNRETGRLLTAAKLWGEVQHAVTEYLLTNAPEKVIAVDTETHEVGGLPVAVGSRAVDGQLVTLAHHLPKGATVEFNGLPLVDMQRREKEWRDLYETTGPLSTCAAPKRPEHDFLCDAARRAMSMACQRVIAIMNTERKPKKAAGLARFEFDTLCANIVRASRDSREVIAIQRLVEEAARPSSATGFYRAVEKLRGVLLG